MGLVTRVALVVICVMIASCTSVEPYRTCGLPGVAVEKPTTECTHDAAVERTSKFDIGYVEFTDQGWLYSRKQLMRTLDLLREPDERNLQIVVFVHGWKHSAKFGDLDVTAFRTTVMPAFANRRLGFRTVGIYVGWRGASLDLSHSMQNISFYDRKSTADHVARGSVRELFSYLRAIRGNKTGRAGRKVSVVLIGHSFGGLILFNSIAESLLDSLVAANSGDSSSPRLAEPVVDLAILLNPAFEASRFEPLFQVAKDRLSDSDSSWSYGEKQRPIFVSITSEADGATKTAFPIGRNVNSVFEHEGLTDQDDPALADYSQRLEKVANTHTIGHMDRYRTHRLTLTASGEPSAEKDRHTQPIACSVVQNPLLADGNRFPLWNMYATADVINAHHDIYGDNLWKFIAAIPDRQVGRDPVCK